MFSIVKNKMNKLKLKESIYILKESEDIYQVIFTGTRKIKRFGVDPLVKTIIEELKSERTEESLKNKLKKDYSPEDVELCLSSLEKVGIIRKYQEKKSNERFSRQLSFIDELTESWEETLELQNRLEKSVVSVFGVGGIGSWMVNSLYQLGIGEIRITDPDEVNKSNLNRQLFFDSADIGKYKVDVIKSKLPDGNIIPFRKIVSQEEDLEEIILGSNFLVNCADSPSVVDTSNILDRYARKYNIPYCVAGGYNMHLGMIGPIIVPGKTATFRDFIEYQKSNDPLRNLEKIKDIEQTGSLGPIAGAVANIQAMEIFKFLIGKGEVNFNKFAEINFMNFDIEWRYFGNKIK